MAALVLLLPFGVASQAAAADQIYFSATDNITNVLVQKINAETQRIDMSAWYLTEHSISIALVNRFKAGVPVRLIGDRGSIFEIDPPTRAEFYWLASQGVPIRLRYNPDFFPEIDHWKFTLFSGQNTIAFGSANYTPFELAPVSPPGSPSPNYKDEIVMVTDDSALVNGFRTKFDQIWNDTMVEPQSIVNTPPYLKNWDDACTFEQRRGGCTDYTTLYPTRTPMVINTARLEPDYPLPPDVVWGQGPEWNQRLIDEINGETNFIDFVIYRLTVPNITQALLNKIGKVPMRIIVEPQEYLNRKWPEFWLSHAYEDLLWAMGVPMKQRVHTGLTHMKVLISSSHASVSSSNLAEAWERDHNYMLPAASKLAAYNAIRSRFDAMWNDPSAFGPFVPGPPDAAENVSPISGAGGVSTAPTLVWNRAAFATRYEVLFGTSQSSLSTVGAVDAVLTSTPPDTYSFSLSGLQPNTTYFWRVRSLTNATVRDGSIQAFSPIAAFTTGGTGGGGSLPSPWVKDDIAATAPGSASFSSGTFTVTSTSADIWGSSDSFTFVHQPVSGDTQVVARVASMGNSSSFAKAGVMLRAGTGASAAHVLLSVRPTGDLEFMTRSSNGGQTSYLGGGFKTPPTWVRLQRTGSTVTAAYSSDGSSWTTIGSTSLSTSNIEAGLIVCSHASTASTSTFDNVTVSGVSNPGPPGTPGSPSPANNATGVSTSQTLTWSASNATSYDVRFGTSNPPPQVSSSQPAASYTPSLSASTTYFWQIVARNSGGSTTGPVWTFTTGGGGGGGSLPSPWVKDDIAANAPGTASFASGTFTVTSTSSDIWGSSDSFTYVHQTVSGDTQIVARVASTSNSSSFAKAGIMLRAGTG
ncbi:MAG TPA: phospholipase D-like domain-containing protein, partial [Vicinamibacterales bacterium]|nr:phospholipase D-like domain-containing protein [Vicinamibacterales bacterium]